MDPPGDPGGTSPQDLVAHFVTIEPNESSAMDTDCSVHDNSKQKRKRSSAFKKCSHCNKKKRRSHATKNESDCKCLEQSTELVQGPEQVALEEIKLSKGNSAKVVSSDNLNGPNPNNTSHSTSVNRTLYKSCDAAPYVVHVQKQTESLNDRVTLHPITFGRFLKSNSFKNVVNGSLKKIGRNKLSLSFSNYVDANIFITHDSLTNNCYKAFIPSFHLTRMGVVRGVPVDLSPDEVMSNISVPVGCGNILKVRRIKKKVVINGEKQFHDTETVVLTFDGQVLPKRVFMCFTSLPVDLYIYPTIQCFNCCRYGHVKDMCRSKPKCYKCGQDHYGGSCSVNEDFISCCLCHGSHSATSRKCPEYERQRQIKETMAKSCMSYAEASKVHGPITKLYSEILTSPPKHNISQIHNFTPNSNQYPPLNQQSYKKTVFVKPRSPPKPTVGYDRGAHLDLIKDYNVPPPNNGSVFKYNENKSNNESIEELIISLMTLLTNSKFCSPSNVATIIETILQTLNNNGSVSQGNSVELSEHQ